MGGLNRNKDLNNMARILIVFSSTDGHTEKICTQLKRVIEQNAHQATVVAIQNVQQAGLETFDKLIVGASIRYGKHSKLIFDFIERNLPLLERKSNAFFSSISRNSSSAIGCTGQSINMTVALSLPRISVATALTW